MKRLYFLFILCPLYNLAICQTDIKPNIIIGQHYGGGIIFYIDPDGLHGLIAAPLDQPGFATWGDEGLSGANFMNDGALNTKKIIAYMKTNHYVYLQLQGPPAACMCDSSTFSGYNDWYLPSINELKYMYDKQSVICSFVAGDYCSSTESNSSQCWNIHFKPAKRIIFHHYKIHDGYNVRCIRKF